VQAKARIVPSLLMNIHPVPFTRPTALDDATRPGVAPTVTGILAHSARNAITRWCRLGFTCVRDVEQEEIVGPQLASLLFAPREDAKVMFDAPSRPVYF
jgi:hypothetical protein